MHKHLNVEIKGVAPLLLHNGQLANPLNPTVKAMKVYTGKRKKTDDDFAALAKLEWHGSLYLDADGNIAIPGENIEAMLIKASKKVKLGELFKAGIIVDGNFPVLFAGQGTDLEALWADENNRLIAKARVGTASVMRTRPIFRDWGLKFTVSYLPDVLNVDQVKESIVTAGRVIGLCDWRPKYGRFEVESVESISA